MAAEGSSPGLVNDIKELADLVRDYAKQETLGPLKRAGNYVGLGVAGAFLVALGVVFLAIAGLRALQDETGSTFTGSLSWIPYLIVTLGLMVVLAICGAAISREN